jgi:two-component system, response regulator RegA
VARAGPDRAAKDHMTEGEHLHDRPTLLLVDDDATLRGLLRRALAEKGFEVTDAPSGEAALALARQEPPEYAVVDLRVPGMSGIEILKELRALDPNTKVLMLSGFGSIASAVEATKLGAVGYLTKPAGAGEITATLMGWGPEGAGAVQEAPSLARAEWEHIQRVLAECGGSISRASQLLNLHRRTLQRKLKRPPPAR